MASPIKDRVLNAEQSKELFGLLGDPKNIDTPTICKLFAKHKKSGQKFSPSDRIIIGPEQSKFVKPNTVTTVGIYILNKFLFEDLEIFGYINKTVSNKFNSKIENALSKALQEGDITVDQYANYIDRAQYLLGGPMAMVINVSISETMLWLPPEAKKLKKKLLEENAEGIKANDPNVASHIEHAVVDKALEEMHKTNDPALAYFDSGCGIDAYNQYKTIVVMKGAIQDNTGESASGYKIITSNYDEGISKEDMPKIADAVVTTAYSSGVATQDSGTNGKRYNATYQDKRLLDPGSDCGSTTYFETVLQTGLKDSYIYRYISDNGKLIMLTPDNIDKYVGQKIKLRTPLHCMAEEPCFCSKCVGDRPYRLGTRNIGFFFMTISGSTLNAALKKKHDVSVKLYPVSVDEVLKYVDQ